MTSREEMFGAPPPSVLDRLCGSFVSLFAPKPPKPPPTKEELRRMAEAEVVKKTALYEELRQRAEVVSYSSRRDARVSQEKSRQEAERARMASEHRARNVVNRARDAAEKAREDASLARRRLADFTPAPVAPPVAGGRGRGNNSGRGGGRGRGNNSGRGGGRGNNSGRGGGRGNNSGRGGGRGRGGGP